MASEGVDPARFEADDSVLQHLLCAVCTMVVRDPVQFTCPGQHIFCARCIGEWMSDDVKCCPIDRVDGTVAPLAKANRILNEMYLSLRVSCGNVGCEAVVPMGSLDVHRNSAEGCAFEQQQCPQGCAVLRKDLATHEARCNAPVPCPLPGCDVRVGRLDLEQHMQAQPLEHLLGLCRELKDTQARVAGLEARAAELERSHLILCDGDPLEKLWVSSEQYTFAGYTALIGVERRGAHVGAYVCFVVGPEDERLKWPFEQRIRFEVLSVAGRETMGCRELTSARSRAKFAELGRPTWSTYSGALAWGFPKLVPVEEFRSPCFLRFTILDGVLD